MGPYQAVELFDNGLYNNSVYREQVWFDTN